jgi:hypothetical protein
MARPIRRKSSRKRRLEQELKQGLDELAAARRILEKAEEEAMEGFFLKPRTFQRITDKDYRTMMRLTKRFGLYEPTATTLTPARKRAIRQHFAQLEDLTKNAVFAEYPQGASKKTRNTINRELRKAYPRAPAARAYFSGEEVAPRGRQLTTKRGIWLPKSERQLSAPVGTLKYDRDTKTWAVQVSRKTKSGLMAQELRYIAGSDVLERKQALMQRRFDRMQPMKRNQRLRFIIGKNESRRTFRNMDELFRYASRYRRDDQARATFLNELIIEVVEKGRPVTKRRGTGKRARSVKDPWSVHVRGFRASNMHELGPDVIRDLVEEMEDEDEE